MKFDKQKWFSILRKVFIVLGYTSMFVSVLVAFAFSNQEANNLPVKKLNIAVYPIDLHFYNRQRVLEEVKPVLPRNKKLIGMPMGEVDVAKMEAALSKKLLIEKAEVYTDLNGELNLSITQRRPVLRVIRYDGTQFYIDQYGVKIPLSEYYTCKVPIASGNIFERYEKGDSVYSFVGKQLFKMASYVDKHPFYDALIDQIFVRADNELILVPKIGSEVIVFGDVENLEAKFKKLLVFYQEGLNRIGWNAYKSIDLRFDGQVICKK
jgi:cell division protein FtsQ